MFESTKLTPGPVWIVLRGYPDPLACSQQYETWNPLWVKPGFPSQLAWDALGTRGSENTLHDHVAWFHIAHATAQLFIGPSH